MNKKKHTVIVVAGPTAVGKTGIAIRLAQHFNTSIISADSRQCFREMDIGVAKPSPAQLAAVPHYFINTHSIHEDVTAAHFEQYALAATEQIFRDSTVAIMAGGTGLYVKAFCEGLDEMPAVPAAVREQVRAVYAQEGMPFLQQELAKKDPQFWEVAEQQNPQRLLRALEVLWATGNSISTYRRQAVADRPFNIIKIGLELPREVLYQNINTRVDEMISAGLVAEARTLLPHQQLNALQTVGYKEMFHFFNGQSSLPEAVEEIKKNTRHYAKRQMTWFRKDAQFRWFAPSQLDVMIQVIEELL